jgi:hypothetical protein
MATAYFSPHQAHRDPCQHYAHFGALIDAGSASRCARPLSSPAGKMQSPSSHQRRLDQARKKNGLRDLSRNPLH